MAGRNLHASSLGSQDLLLDDGEDPMASMGNLMDAMLVFACGLLLALIATWDVDLDDVRSSAGAPDITKLEGDVQESEGASADDIEDCTELGTAYYDEETGQVYVVSPGAEEG